MRIAVFGAGAVGSMIAACLARAEHDPVLIARGERLAAIREHGLTLVEKEDRFTVPIRTGDDAAAFGRQDAVVLGLKAHQLSAAADAVRPLIGPDTLIVPALNGIPWWYFKTAREGVLSGRDLRSVDPAGTLAAAFPGNRVAGCVVYVAAEVQPPATVESQGIRRLILGMAEGGPAPALAGLSKALEEAGFRAILTDDIRSEAWNKLWGNIWANPLSVITGMTMAEMHADPALRNVALAMLEESAAVARALGVTFPMDAETKLAHGARLGSFKTSMLQDFERGRAIEIDAILGAVIEIAEAVGTDTPTLRTIYAVTRARAVAAGCYRPPQ